MTPHKPFDLRVQRQQYKQVLVRLPHAQTIPWLVGSALRHAFLLFEPTSWWKDKNFMARLEKPEAREAFDIMLEGCMVRARLLRVPVSDLFELLISIHLAEIYTGASWKDEVAYIQRLEWMPTIRGRLKLMEVPR